MKAVIDVHAHIFNARDIPAQGYLLSRKYKGRVEKILSPIIIPLIARYLRETLSPPTGIVSKFLGAFALNVIADRMGKGYKTWATTLANPVTGITQEMLNTFQDFDLYVPLMIDYEYWFRHSRDHDNPLTEQIETVYEHIVLPYQGKIHPFVPFDPTRELAFRRGKPNPYGEPESHGALALVKDAIENKGFIGVKVYNSLGYKPLNNSSVDAKRWRIFRRNKTEQYIGFAGEDYDDVLAELYDYCVQNEVPITAHCLMDGIEGQPGASWDFCQPIFWVAVLGQDRFRDLRLNLAHFGWSKREGYLGKESWVKQICLMLPQYGHLFTDVAHHLVTVDKENQKFKEEYRAMFRDLPGLVPLLKKRLLFGIDWHVIERVENYQAFKRRYVEILRDECFSDAEIEDFLGGNALNFLGLLPGGKNRQRLEKFYLEKGITPPAWFESTSSA